MKNIYKFSLIYLMLFILSCNNTRKNNSADKIINNRTVIYFSGIEIYDPFKVEKSKKFEYYVTTYLNTSCPACLNEIKQWNTVNKMLSKNSCGIHMVCYSEDYFEYFKYLCEQGNIKKFDYPFLLDTTNTFKKRNPIFDKSESDKTVLVNKYNEVLAVGSPVHSEKKLNEFIEIINQNESNN